MDIKKVAITGAVIAGSFTCGVRTSSFIWKRALVKLLDEIEADSKKRREENRYQRSNYPHYSPRSQHKARPRQASKVNKWNDVRFTDIRDAMAVLSSMTDLINDYGFVTVADLCRLLGRTSDLRDNLRGWYNLDEVSMSFMYFVNFPDPVTLIKGDFSNETKAD